MSDDLTALIVRRDRFAAWGKWLLIIALSLYLCLMVLNAYEPLATDYLLTASTSYLASLLNIEASDRRYIWGGPMTLFSLQAVTYGLSAIGVMAVIWQRLRRGRWSRLGLLLWLSPPLVGLTALTESCPRFFRRLWTRLPWRSCSARSSAAGRGSSHSCARAAGRHSPISATSMSRLMAATAVPAL